MEFSIRPARPDDVDAIAAFTQDTFAWGDYVADALPSWLEERNGLVLVAVDADDVAIGVNRAVLLSPTEAWFQGIRVHPDMRRRGIGAALSERLVEWCREQGASVIRLLIEDWNEASQLATSKAGFRHIGNWAMAGRTVGDASPLPIGNGGRRVPAQEQLTRAHSAEAEPALMAWTGGSLYRPSRGLFAVGWTLRRLTVDDLERAARHEALWVARSGWAMAARDDDLFEVGWLSTSEEDARDLVRALVDLAVESGAERIRLMLPAVPWLLTAARKAGCELHLMGAWALPL